MNAIEAVIIGLTVVGCVVLAIALARSGHPENGCGHLGRRRDSESARFSSGADRPGDPGAEAMLVEVAGNPQPGAPDQPGGQLGAPTAPGDRAAARTGGSDRSALAELGAEAVERTPDQP